MRGPSVLSRRLPLSRCESAPSRFPSACPPSRSRSPRVGLDQSMTVAQCAAGGVLASRPTQLSLLSCRSSSLNNEHLVADGVCPQRLELLGFSATLTFLGSLVLLVFVLGKGLDSIVHWPLGQTLVEEAGARSVPVRDPPGLRASLVHPPPVRSPSNRTGPSNLRPKLL